MSDSQPPAAPVPPKKTFPWWIPIIPLVVILVPLLFRSGPRDIVLPPIGEPQTVKLANDGFQVTFQGRQIEVKEDEQGIAVTETETKDGKKVEQRYTVYDADELAKKNPELYETSKSMPMSLPWRRHFKIVDKDGRAGLEFNRWLLVFEAVPAQSVPIGLKTSEELPRALADLNTRRRGDTEKPAADNKPRQIIIDGMMGNGLGPMEIQARIGGLGVSSWGGNTLSVNGCSFQFTERGKKLVFADHTYEAAETPTTIIVSQDGKTREQANK